MMGDGSTITYSAHLFDLYFYLSIKKGFTFVFIRARVKSMTLSTGNYRGATKDNQVYDLPLNLHYNRCRKCRGHLKFISTDGKRNTWSCRCGLFAVRLPISGYEKRETEILRLQAERREALKMEKLTKANVMAGKLNFKERWLARVKLQRSGALK